MISKQNPAIAQAKAIQAVAEKWTVSDLRMIRYLCESSLFHFFRVMHREYEGARALYSWHHRILIRVLEEVAAGLRTRVLINCPPGFTKTLLVVRYFNAWILARNPRARNLHISYSEDLALGNSQDVKGVIQTDLFRAIWGLIPRIDKQAKGLWEIDEHGGGLKASATGGQVTGFRAGRLEDGFNGVLTWDDPIKPEDALFQTIRKRINKKYGNTIQSRLARPDTPIVIIAQRTAEDDPSGFLLRGGSDEIWDHLIIPAEVTEDREDYPPEYTHGRPIQYPAPLGPTWPLKIDQKYAATLKGDPILWSTQYQQKPREESGEIFHRQWWGYYEEFDAARSVIVDPDGEEIRVKYKMIYGDTAQKTGERNDFSVFQLWAKGADGRIYLLDQIRGKWEAPDLEEKCLEFCDRHGYKRKVNPMGIRAVKVEDKSSGTGLIQSINKRKKTKFIEGIPRDKDKVSRSKGAAPSISRGLVVLPRGATWLPDYMGEFALFKSDMSHDHDDQIDPTLDAIYDMLIDDRRIGYGDHV